MPQYSRAPIAEAVIDVHFSAKLSARDLERVRDSFKKRYPSVQDRMKIQVQLQNGRATSSAQLEGYQLNDADGNNGLLVLTNGFATTRLAPYAQWESLSRTAKENYEAFLGVVGRQTVKRIGTRFVNRFDIPNEKINGQALSKFFTIYTRMPNVLNRLTASNFAFSGTEQQTGLATNISFSSVMPPALLEHQSFVLDIDVYTHRDLSMRTDELWGQVDGLRTAKNNVFEGAITDELRALIL